MNTYLLTKSRYISGLQCEKKLWKELNLPAGKREYSLGELERFAIGNTIGALAREGYPGGILVETLEPDTALRLTEELVQQNVPAIFEAAFFYDEIYVRVDILKNNFDGTWGSIEVKSGTTCKELYIQDAALQYHCVTGAGITLTSVHIQHINNKCVYPDLSNLFTIDDITQNVHIEQADIRRNTKKYKKLISGKEPNIAIGKHCDDPSECEYKPDCWKDVPEPSIFQIKGLHWKRKNELISEGILGIDNPEKLNLSDKQNTYLERLRSGIPEIDKKTIAQKLSALEYPLYFFDFETDYPAIPHFDGCSPYMQYPYQYSCHIMQEDGMLEHREYLHTDLTDPRQPLTVQMIEDLGETGTIIAYNASFEIGVIRDLAKHFPYLEEKLTSLILRFWDQLLIFRKDYLDPRFRGTNSLKAVLPVLIPSLNYDLLEDVHNGGDAGVIWRQAIRKQDVEMREKDFRNLRAYCGLDTFAMVEIHRYLQRLVQKKASFM